MGSFINIVVIIVIICVAVMKQNQGQKKGPRQTQSQNPMQRPTNGQPWPQNGNPMQRPGSGQPWPQNGNPMQRPTNGQPWPQNGNPMQRPTNEQPWVQNENSYARQQQNMDDKRMQGKKEAALMQKQRELKEKLQQKYSKTQPGYKNQQGTNVNDEEKQPAESRKYNESLDQSGDIMDRVTASAKERNITEEITKNQRKINDSISQADRADIMMEVMDFRDSSKLMEEVSDLIIMGYQSKLPFDRDFVEEGLQMLGQYKD